MIAGHRGYAVIRRAGRLPRIYPRRSAPLSTPVPPPGPTRT